MSEAQKIFSDYLGQEGLKMTPQRMVILNVFLKVNHHVSSEELYENVKKADAGIGQATVYRTLKLLEDAGIAGAVDFGDGMTRYEPDLGQGHHDHLICEKCGKNVEILNPEIERLQEEVARQYGFTLSCHKMYLYGLCQTCQTKKTK